MPEELHLADTTYALFACIYGGDSHFVSLVVRDFTSNRLLKCDGMNNNNAQFVEYNKGSAGKFPLSLMGKRLEKAYFVRSEYANLTNKR